MPRIRWNDLPPALRDHLFDRLREHKITADDLYQLKAWRESNPDAPDGLWYKDFGSFKICGDGKYLTGGTRPRFAPTSARRSPLAFSAAPPDARQSS
jgi:hypothetical protein